MAKHIKSKLQRELEKYAATIDIELTFIYGTNHLQVYAKGRCIGILSSGANHGKDGKHIIAKLNRLKE